MYLVRKNAMTEYLCKREFGEEVVIAYRNMWQDGPSGWSTKLLFGMTQVPERVFRKYKKVKGLHQEDLEKLAKELEEENFLERI